MRTRKKTSRRIAQNNNSDDESHLNRPQNEVLDRLAQLAMHDLGNSRRNEVTTGDVIRRAPVHMPSVYRDREVNVEGTEAADKATANRSAINAWNNPQSIAGGKVGPDLGDINRGQEHRAELTRALKMSKQEMDTGSTNRRGGLHGTSRQSKVSELSTPINRPVTESVKRINNPIVRPIVQPIVRTTAESIKLTSNPIAKTIVMPTVKAITKPVTEPPKFIDKPTVKPVVKPSTTPGPALCSADEFWEWHKATKNKAATPVQVKNRFSGMLPTPSSSGKSRPGLLASRWANPSYTNAAPSVSLPKLSFGMYRESKLDDSSESEL